MNNLLLVIIVAGILSACKHNNTLQTGGIPELILPTEIYNFGNLEAGEISSYSFKIINGGDGKLKIDSIAKGCGCITVNWPKQELARGEQGFIQVTYDSGGEWGNIYQSIEIYSNGSENKKNVYIAAKVNNQLFN